ncbi:AraC family transcriptional regulator [Mesorhizobium sp. M7A.F.Ca.CA.001.07.2.1]|nr:AraC family transcriptional regulator [Mesorhizobium sp. M7A.F.Ca.CA.004.08.2.1]RUX87879.1 AraC family transcriptional regulator [Mesorhizobium sp. M7A.F.Ca.CA.004.08.1.1]RUY01152.1 AraC family transcriptional regulator [Mesorhizobium sp. M7A.F.Ca.CA.004.04.1.1]RUY54777.1 AraC family transcriptional regulator [Mesorhizobium sp. M7A.F.Ca.CA.001.12.1.1]RUY85378.1 AraC family transcriptional regulator [Mesorhizobium sp. M7A.F.Ca.CA.001.10.2.1]RUZ45895.1 AraC family transcriptional regulator [M
MTIQSLPTFPRGMAPIGLLVSNAVCEPERRQSASAAAMGTSSMSPETAGSTFRIDVPYMDMVLSISAQPSGCASDEAGFTRTVASHGMPFDPVIERLLSQFEQAVRPEGVDGVHGDAILHAILARWLWLRSPSEVQQEANHGALQKWRLKRVMAYVDEHIGEAISLADLARAAGLSRMYFAARFRMATSLRPHEYILRRRIERAKDMLIKTNDSLVDIAFNVGFQTQAHFTTVFKRFAGITPGRWRQSNRLQA